MRIAALYDIHGNLPALEASLEEVREAGPDLVVVGGDVIPGPMVKETLDLLLGLDLPTRFIHGNGESAALAVRNGRGEGLFSDAVRPVMEWTAQQLDPQVVAALSLWPLTTTVVEGDQRILFCHATPRDDNEVFTAVTPVEGLEPAFQGVEADVVVCGHIHIQYSRNVAGIGVWNAGSVGMPFDAPGAYWLLLEDGDVTFRRTDYDLEDAARRIRRTDYPQAEEFAGGNVLRPPARETMEERLEKVAIAPPRD